MKRQGHKIAVIGARSYPPEFVGTSGIEFYLQHTIAAFKKGAFSFLLFTKSMYGSDDKTVLGNVRVVPVFTCKGKVLESVSYSFFASIVATFSDASVVWYNGIGTALFCFIPLCFSKKIVITLHGADWRRQKWSQFQRRLFTLVSWLVLRLPVTVTSVSETTRIPVLKKRVIHTPPGLVFPKQRKNQGSLILEKVGVRKKKYILYVGRLVPEKRIEWLCKAFMLIQKSNPELQLVIAGSPSTTSEYHDMLRNTFKNKKIIFIGSVFGEDKRQLLENARSCVVPSALEGFPIILMEVVPLHVPMVIGESFVPKDVQQATMVFPFRVLSFTSFCYALAKSLRKPKKNSSLTLLEKKYSWDHTAETYSALFTKLMEGHSRTR